MISPIDAMLWGVLPYVVLAVFIGGTIWRYRYDKFGWTSRSSQLHESRLLRVGSPLFHYGLLLVVGGHVLGLLVPKALTEFFGVTEQSYHVVSLLMGTIAGCAALAGLVVLLWRRLRTEAVRRSSSRSDQLTYVLLIAVMSVGLWTTVVDNGVRGPYDYRESIGPWFRDIFVLQPHPELMANAPLDYRLHALLALALFALWPFSRLVHAFSAPVHYLFRPYIVYRSRSGDRVGTRQAPRGWQQP
ncbi:nitrate reductase gamma subunit [Saccharopolyspora antimicrobica]|uniref:Nitrate reductase-like protein NarX n=1 Tax=Saccharopolyspora antimicrobica TaxID=455193 RepID=A0A1I5GLR4_9PSEU|nr:respiratory nitrate reductase subunit gamma [Saccharopolyspora antimicrobica]RKT87472.1 respiratory nitrate reductase gamma subunit [Saccharopolyspora antimicrobica]SFO36948.1 nitrate reductase gamma subunit [Saccharopolyspora antimicrobica]